MLADAFRAEAFRLSKSRTVWFWSVFFVPILTLVGGVIANLVVNANAQKMLADSDTPPEVRAMAANTPLDIGQGLIGAMGDLSNPMVLLFVLIGAATLYAGDYRWETWRLISARNSRTNLLLGKLGVVIGLALVSMLTLLVVGVIGDIIRAAIFGRTLTFSLSGGDVGKMALLFGLSLLQIVQFTMFGLLAAVFTRSLLAALFVPLVMGIAQFFLPAQILPPMGFLPDSWLSIMVAPGSGIDTIKTAIKAVEPGDGLKDGMALKAWLSILVWTILPLIGALLWFKQQDLSKE